MCVNPRREIVPVHLQMSEHLAKTEKCFCYISKIFRAFSTDLLPQSNRTKTLSPDLHPHTPSAGLGLQTSLPGVYRFLVAVVVRLGDDENSLTLLVLSIAT